MPSHIKADDEELWRTQMGHDNPDAMLGGAILHSDDDGDDGWSSLTRRVTCAISTIGNYYTKLREQLDNDEGS